MFRSLLAGKSRRKVAILGGALVGVLTPLAAQASLTINLQLAQGAAGATQTVKYLTPDNNGKDVPIYVYASVAGTTTTFQGFQYAYYNVNFATVNASIAASLDTTTSAMAIDPAATSTYNFDGLGQQQSPKDVYPGDGIGSASNTAAGILAGSTTVLSDIAHPRANSNSPAWSTSTSNANYAYSSNGGKTENFLVETLEVKPSVFTASTTAAGGQNYTKFTPSIPNVAAIGGIAYTGLGANWNEDSTSNTGDGTVASIKNSTSGTYQASTQFMTFEDTLKGDANGDGSVTIADFNIVAANLNKPGPFTWAQGDFTGDGLVTIADFNIVAANLNKTLTNITPTIDPAEMSELTAFAAANNDLATFDAITGVPEPTSLGLLALGGVSLLRRRRNR
jgi:hypothetical protein